MKILMLTKYGSLGASSRMRSYQYLPYFNAERFECSIQPFFTNEQLARRYSTGKYGPGELIGSYARRLLGISSATNFDILWIEKEALPWLPASFERALLSRVPYVLDYDDALFHNYDLHRIAMVRRAFGGRLDFLMAGASLVVAGNRYLAKRATDACASRVEVLPTVIDLSRYPVRTAGKAGEARIVWIGSPSTARYLHMVRDPLATLSKDVPFTLRIVGGGPIDMPGVKTEILSWSAETEADAIGECDVGIMPLEDSPWERGKCAYKLIQYMACGLPTVASPVGANVDVVVNGGTGYLAHDTGAWVGQLKRLLQDRGLRASMGARGRARVEQHYCIQRTAPRLINLLSEVVRTSR